MPTDEPAHPDGGPDLEARLVRAEAEIARLRAELLQSRAEVRTLAETIPGEVSRTAVVRSILADLASPRQLLGAARRRVAAWRGRAGAARG